MVSALLSDDLLAMLYGIRRTYWPMIFFVAGVSIGEDWVRIRQLWRLLVAILTALALSGIVLTYFVPDYWTSLYLSQAGNSRDWGLDAIAREGGLRMTGAILDPVVFGITCGWGLVLSFSAYCVACNFKHCLLYGFAFVVCLIGVAFSLSRGAWLGSLLSVFVCLLFNPKWMLLKRLVLPFFMAAYCGLIANILLAGADLGQGYEIFSRTIEKTVSEGNWQRQAQFDGVLNNLVERPLGNGLGMAGHVGAGLSFNGITEDGYPHITDGWYLKLLAEGGIPLFVAFIAYLIIAIIAIAKAVSLAQGPQLKAFLSAMLGIQIGLIAQAAASNIWDLYYLSQISWLLGGISIASSAGVLRRHAQNPPITHRIRQSRRER